VIRIMSNDPDLDGFPVLRIDQIPLISTDILERANVEVLDLIESVKSDGDSQKSLVYYLYRQLNEMEKEVAKRAAEDRVMSLLTGTERALNRMDHPKIITPKRVQSISSLPTPNIMHETPNKRISTSQSDHSAERRKEPIDIKEPTEAPRPMLIPLPSELRRRELASAVSTVHNDSENVSVISSRSSGGEGHTPSSPGGVSEHSGGGSRLRPRPKSGQPTRRSQAALEENFGSAFVVGATERKKRFYPKKVVQETEEQVRARARESR
jgi:hypothetical protein